ncbi:hypothetical protein [Singulisphaera sp. PoT]|uniref:hypothetical protein n=1 Tax=Singulisphaera sp. PoT TaxID=3411797 RepID=UPI003BF53ADE
MPLSVTGNIKFTLSLAEQLGSGPVTGNLNSSIPFNISFANGTGANAIQFDWVKPSSPAPGTPDTWTLSALTDSLNRAIAFTKVRVLVIINNGTGSLTVGAAATHPWAAALGTAGTAIVPAGGMLVLVAPGAAGYAVTSGSSDQLKVDPGGTAGNYQIAIAGE